MKAKLITSIGAVMLCAAVMAQAPGVQTVSEVESRQASADLQAFKARVAAANPGLDVVKVEEDVVRRAVLAPPPPPPRKAPVMAIFGLTLSPVTRDASAVVSVIPAEGPSLGTAPAGTWICRSFSSNIAAFPGYMAFTRLTAICADSFITSPS